MSLPVFVSARDTSPLAQICVASIYVNSAQETLKYAAELNALFEPCRTAVADRAEAGAGLPHHRFLHLTTAAALTDVSRIALPAGVGLNRGGLGT